LTPTDKNKSFHKVYLLVNKLTSTISSARFLEKTGSRYVYSINSLNGSASSKDSDFTFDKNKHPGVEVVDLR
jgi:outer membrane lipoprotein carrier protein